MARRAYFVVQAFLVFAGGCGPPSAPAPAAPPVAVPAAGDTEVATVEELIAARERIPRGAQRVGRGEIVLEYREPAVAAAGAAGDEFLRGHREGWDGCLIQFQWDGDLIFAPTGEPDARSRGREAGHADCRARLVDLVARFGKAPVREAFGL